MKKSILLLIILLILETTFSPSQPASTRSEKQEFLEQVTPYSDLPGGEKKDNHILGYLGG